ncbi:MAG: hypothetical protein PHW76_04440 [Alphaproteobacteria bacterium]|nr:hypothetical protein [Alphaproteobacteria bacterium]
MKMVGKILGKDFLKPLLEQGENPEVLFYGPFWSGKSVAADKIAAICKPVASQLRNKDFNWSAHFHKARMDKMEKKSGRSKLDIIQHPTPEFLERADLVVVISRPLGEKPKFDIENEYYFNANLAELGTVASDMESNPASIYWQTNSIMQSSREDTATERKARIVRIMVSTKKPKIAVAFEKAAKKLEAKFGPKKRTPDSTQFQVLNL